MTFNSEIKDFLKKAGGKQDEFMKKFALEIANEVRQKTPVDTGFLRNSWAPSIGQIDTSKATGNVTQSDFDIVFSSLTIKDVAFITNNANYVGRIEFGFVGKTDSLGRTFSGPAPAAMVRNTISQANNIARRVISTIQ